MSRPRIVVPFVSIDPGVEYCACAWWAPMVYDDGTPIIGPWLARVAMVPKTDWSNDPGVSTAVIERPQIYRQGKAKTKDVEGLLIASGVIASHFDQVVWYRPAVWKGQQPKPAHHEKILKALHKNELTALEGHSKKDLKHILDAVGLGLFHLERLT